MKKVMVQWMVVALFFAGGCDAQKYKKNSTKELPQKSEPLFHEDGRLKFISSLGKNLTSISFELADTLEKRNQGLMYRHSLKNDQGMLFVFNESKFASFYMKNTYIPLDVFFIDEQKKIIKIFKNTVPLSLTSLLSDKPVQYAVEVNAGFSDQCGICEGDSITYTISSKEGA